MNVNEKTLARILFRSKIAFANGQAYEDLFVDVMRRDSSDFVPVKPQGRVGDRKNDGYNRTTGCYYQVFAPENPAMKQQAAVKKLKTDFSGLMAYWDTITPVREFHFAFNDKYSGAFPEMIADLAAIEKSYKLDDCSCFLAQHLEERLLLLPDDAIQAVIGYIPDPGTLLQLDYSILNEVIGHIMTYKGEIAPSQLLKAPDFEHKITFNFLSPPVGALLRSASYQVGILEGYFALNSVFAKQSIRNTLNQMYQNALAKLQDVEEAKRGDLVFFEILNTAAPGKMKAVRDAVLVVMAYFFESCDIFEDPP